MRNRAIHVLIGQNQYHIEIPENPRKTLTFLIKYFQCFEKQFRLNCFHNYVAHIIANHSYAASGCPNPFNCMRHPSLSDIWHVLIGQIWWMFWNPCKSPENTYVFAQLVSMFRHKNSFAIFRKHNYHVPIPDHPRKRDCKSAHGCGTLNDCRDSR